jgi:mannosyltransferase OCH1-like enzyme
MILDQVGGLYVDLDYEALKPLDPLVRKKGAWLLLPRITRGRSKPYVHNALMAAVPSHPFLGLAIAEACRRWKKHPSAWVEWISGPMLITEISGQLADRSVAPLFLGQDAVTPLDWAAQRKGWRDIMADPAKAFPEASAITYWSHNW